MNARRGKLTRDDPDQPLTFIDRQVALMVILHGRKRNLIAELLGLHCETVWQSMRRAAVQRHIQGLLDQLDQIMLQRVADRIEEADRVAQLSEEEKKAERFARASAAQQARWERERAIYLEAAWAHRFRTAPGESSRKDVRTAQERRMPPKVHDNEKA
jgi:hypothetical protein